MRILLFTSLYPNKAQPNYGLFVEKRLLELKKRYSVDAHVIAPVPWYPAWLSRLRKLPKYHEVPKTELRFGIQIEHPRYFVVPGISWRFAPIFLAWASKNVAKRIKREFHFDLIDAHFFFPDGVAAFSIARNLEVPCLITARGSDINESPKFLLPRIMIKRTLKRLDRVVAVSERIKRVLIKLGSLEDKVVVLPNGVDTNIFKPSRALGLPDYGIQPPYLLSVGNLRELKGHHLVIRALAENRDLLRCNLVIVGEGAMRNELEELITRLSLADRVKLVGDIPNEKLPLLYSAAQLFILASRNEGCPNVVLEALACGAPVVASNVGAVPELLPKCLHEFMIEERTPALIGEQIAACLAADISRDMIRDHALSLGWDATCEELYHTMQEVQSE